MSEEAQIKIYRGKDDCKYTARTTIGKVYIDGKYFSFSLEDTVRAFGIKVKGETAIPAGRYRIKTTFSSRFKRDMALIYNTKALTLESNGIKFAGIRVHGGNSHNNTEGCPLVAERKLNDTTIQGTKEKDFTKKLKELEIRDKKVYIEIINLPQSG